MKKFTFITDSCANLTDELINELGIVVMPMVYILDGKEYVSYSKNEVTELKKYYEMMRNKTTITTSCISETTCMETFEPILKSGSDLLYLGFSSGLSATYQIAEKVLCELKTKHPDRTILCVDSLGGSLGQGLMAYYAARMQNDGADIQSVCDWLESNRLKVNHLFTVDNLSYLHKGGRLKKTSFIIATTLNIKPLMFCDNNGKLVAFGKSLGRRASLNALVKKMIDTIVEPEKQTIFISHGDCIEDVEYVINHINERIKVKEIVINYIDLVIGAHSGPGTVALFFLSDKR